MNQPEDAENQAPQVVNEVDEQRFAQFVSTIKSAEQQVGEHVVTALRHPNTVAVLTTVAVGSDGQQRLVSAALDPRLMNDVQQLLTSAQDEREPEDPCFGFHCLLNPKPEDDAPDGGGPSDTNGSTDTDSQG